MRVKKMEENKESYETLSVSELKEKANSDPKACLELGNRYLKFSQFQKAEEMFDLAIEMVKENYEGSNEENEFLYSCYFALSRCYEKDSDMQLLNLLNAAEITSNDDKKAGAYNRVSIIYSHRDDDKNFEKYLLKGNYNTKRGCLKIATYYQAKANIVDYEEWLEKAKAIPDKHKSDSFYSDIIDFKIAEHNRATKTYDFVKLLSSNSFISFFEQKETYENFIRTRGDEEDLYDSFLLNYEVDKLVNNVSSICKEKTKEADFNRENTNSLFLACYSLKRIVRQRSKQCVSNINFSIINLYIKDYLFAHISEQTPNKYEKQCIEWILEENDKGTLIELRKLAEEKNNQKLKEEVERKIGYVWALENPEKVMHGTLDPTTGKIVFSEEERRRYKAVWEQEKTDEGKAKVKKVLKYILCAYLVLIVIEVLIATLGDVFGGLIIIAIIVYAIYKTHKVKKLDEIADKIKEQIAQKNKN